MPGAGESHTVFRSGNCINTNETAQAEAPGLQQYNLRSRVDQQFFA